MRFSFSTSQGNRVISLASWLNHLASSDMFEGQSEICCLANMKRSSLPFFHLLICWAKICIVCESARLRHEDHPDHSMVQSLPMIQLIYFAAEEMAHWPLSSFWGPSAQTYHIFPWQDNWHEIGLFFVELWIQIRILHSKLWFSEVQFKVIRYFGYVTTKM